ncbi:MAG: anthrone oxygenase family protein [Pseudoclavibacter sp.]
MWIADALLAVALVTTGISAGVFFAFTSLIVPGLRSAGARETLRGFQLIDSRLQPTSSSTDWQPVFGVVVFGPTLIIPAAFLAALAAAPPSVLVLIAAAAVAYIVGFWLPTIATIVPFNNRVRDMRLDTMSDDELAAARADFDRNWAGWNLVRTVSTAASVALLAAAAVVA